MINDKLSAGGINVNVGEDKQLLLTLQEVAELTRMSLAWWRSATQGKRNMPPVRVMRVGRSVRIHAGDLRAWINGETPHPAPRRRGRPRKTEQVRER